jgi:hypothetical protein
MLKALNLLGVVIFTAGATLQFLSGEIPWGCILALGAAVEAGFVLWGRDSWVSI